MGLIPTSCRLLIALHRRVGLRGPVLTLGNQDVYASHADLEALFREQGCPFAETAPVPHTSASFQEAGGRYRSFVHARTLFAMMGIQDYTDIDLLDADAPTIVHDLNRPVPAGLHDRFNLVVDGGTLEHVFDVRQVMESLVAMCRTSGWIVHLSPASNFVDHGFYSLSPSLFHDVYRANGFDELTCDLVQVDPDDYFAPCPHVPYVYGMDLTELIDPRRQLLVVFAARKARGPGPFVVPIQGAYRRAAGSAPPAAITPPAAGGGATAPAMVRSLLRPLARRLRPWRRRLLPRYRRLPRL
jgi:hypothetical protein